MKIKLIAAFSAAAMMLTSLSAAAENITNVVTNVRLNKPYLNINIEPVGSLDISSMKFALVNSKGEKVATFKGKNGEIELLDNTTADLTGVHDAESYKKKDPYEYRFLEKYYPDSDQKCDYPLGRVEKNGFISYMEAKTGINIGLLDELYLIYTDKSRFKIVDTVTVPANTILIDVDKRYKDTENLYDSFYLTGADGSGQKCSITEKNKFVLYSHAGKRETVTATKGQYEIHFAGMGTGDKCTVSDHAVKYIKVRMKFNDAFPGIATNDLKVTKEYKLYSGPISVTYDLRGKMDEKVFSSLCYSGSAFTAFVPDSNGYVEFWVSDEEPKANMIYNFSYKVTINNDIKMGTGGGGVMRAELPKTREKIRVLMEFPKSGYCIAALKPDKYTIVCENKYDSRDYTLSGASVTVTDTRKMQTVNVKVKSNKRLLGDCNEDGELSVSDIVRISLHIKGYKLFHSRELIVADVNESGSVDVSDITVLAAHIKGKKKIPNKYV